MASHLTMAFVMDPVEGIDIEKDTTFLLMWEAQERGHRVFYVEPADLGVSDRRACARAWPVTLRREISHCPFALRYSSSYSPPPSHVCSPCAERKSK